MFEKYGEVESCSIMKDPHTQESRGFGFVKMVTSDQADAAKEGLQGENIGGRTLSIEKARRARPRTPTPGRYFGPPKRGMPISPLEISLRAKTEIDDRHSRFDDRRGGYRGYRDDYRYDDRRSYGRRDDYSSRGVDRYASSRNDRYARDDRRGDDRRGDRGSDRGGDRDRGDSYYRDPPRWDNPPAGEDRYSRR